MSVRPPADTPADLLILLGRIDGKVDGIVNALAAIQSRADHHEQRINKLEHDNAARATYVSRFESVEKDVDALKAQVDTGRGWLQASNTAKALIVALIGALGYLGF